MKIEKGRTPKYAARRRLGRRIAGLLDERQLTQAALADDLGVDKSAVAHWVRGDTAPGIDVLPKLASLLGTSVDELLSRKVA